MHIDRALKLRARRAYEAGRLVRALAATWPAAVMTGLSYALCHHPVLSLTFGLLLIGATTSMLCIGRWQQAAARTGLEAGMLAFLIPFTGFHLNVDELVGLSAAIVLLNGGGGFLGGLIIGLRSRQIAQKNQFLLAGACVTTLAGLLGCLFFGYFGIGTLLIGVLTATAPVGIYRWLTA
ncbi:MAG: hypothetical protein WD795_13700 [Woeseia sp.]